MSEWIGVDLDGTLSMYPPEQGQAIGSPIKKMVDRVKRWLQEGRVVRIVTARVSSQMGGAKEIFEQTQQINAWCHEHIGAGLPVTSEKDFSMIELWDDRAVQVIPNTGKRADGKN